ncbi:MAG: SH3 domain-containing protein [Alphaproteobacteria bacterium]|nr:SH3 domain-containing protein [Alphaproteobacteria bacterium]
MREYAQPNRNPAQAQPAPVMAGAVEDDLVQPMGNAAAAAELQGAEGSWFDQPTAQATPESDTGGGLWGSLMGGLSAWWQGEDEAVTAGGASDLATADPKVSTETGTGTPSATSTAPKTETTTTDGGGETPATETASTETASTQPATQTPASGPYTDKYGQGSSDARLRVDKGQLTFDAEGTEGGKYHTRTAHWPGGASGVTIGRGYDLGQHSKKDILADMGAAGIAEGDANKFTPAAGKTGTSAKDWLAQNKASLPEISLDQQKLLFNIVYDRLAADVERISGNYARIVSERDGGERKDYEVNWDTIHPAIRDLVVDLRYRGDYTPTSRKKVQPLVIANDLKGLANHMADRTAWSAVPKDRFERRAAYMKEAVEGGGKTDLQGNTPVGGETPVETKEGEGEGSLNTSNAGATYEITASKLNVRSAPDSSKDNKLGTVSAGEQIVITGESQGWIQFRFKEQVAWISADYAKLVSRPEEEKEVKPPAEEQTPGEAPPADSGESGLDVSIAGQTWTITASSLNVRSEPDSGKDNKLGRLSQGARIKVTGRANGWLQFKYNDQTAWISADFARVVSKEELENEATGNYILSGSDWYKRANDNGWKNSTDFDDLDSTFGANCKTFVEGLRSSGATVKLTAGLRHKKRAWLMHYAWHVSKGSKSAASANKACRAEGINIEWDHGTLSKTKSAAAALVSAFGLVHAASLTSNHMTGEAMDMKISNVPKNLTVGGKSYTAGPKGSGQMDEDKVDHIGKALGVIWFGSGDWVHWSKTGR